MDQNNQNQMNNPQYGDWMPRVIAKPGAPPITSYTNQTGGGGNYISQKPGISKPVDPGFNLPEQPSAPSRIPPQVRNDAPPPLNDDPNDWHNNYNSWLANGFNGDINEFMSWRGQRPFGDWGATGNVYTWNPETQSYDVSFDSSGMAPVLGGGQRPTIPTRQTNPGGQVVPPQAGGKNNPRPWQSNPELIKRIMTSPLVNRLAMMQGNVLNPQGVNQPGFVNVAETLLPILQALTSMSNSFGTPSNQGSYRGPRRGDDYEFV